DADLDLDPGALPGYLAAAEREGLDFAIGSKRHPDSDVHYPRSRVVASWMYQQLVRVLFRLDVRDTQVGLKVFRREVAEQVLPLLLVKRYAFDVELLAVSRAFGYGRVKEMPIELDYRFTGSGVRSAAVANALLDTLAVFYRLRILGHYHRAARAGSWSPAEGPHLETTVVEAEGTAARRAAAEQAQGEIIAFLEPGARCSANWLAAAEPFFSSDEIDAVVTPQLAPAGGTDREQAAAVIAESRLGGGSLNFRFKPGRIRFVSDFPATSFLVRRDRFLELDPETPPDEVVRRLDGRTIYLPEASVTIPRAPLFAPHLARIRAYGRARGALVRSRKGAAARGSTIALALLAVWTLGGWALLLAGGAGTDIWLGAWAAYLLAICAAAFFGGLRFSSVRVGLLAVPGLLLTHAFYATSFVSGFLRGPS
ncbi:MAG TPA: hypothetical protein VG265_02790, partial [Gaiellaceae bacterium]|nr:hypothetical protein [Gaiellaceae bacterium]